MKGDRQVIDINDFSGGYDTASSITNLNTNISPDCLNVYAEGKRLRKREGHSKVNTSTVGAGSVGNGLFYWVRNKSNQLLTAVFGSGFYGIS